MTEQGVHVDPAALRKFSDRITHLAALIKSDTDMLTKSTAASNFGTQTIPTFREAHALEFAYSDATGGFASNLADFLAALNGLAGAAGDLAKSYGTATDADLLSAHEVDNEFQNGPATTA